MQCKIMYFNYYCSRVYSSQWDIFLLSNLTEQDEQLREEFYNEQLLCGCIVHIHKTRQNWCIFSLKFMCSYWQFPCGAFVLSKYSLLWMKTYLIKHANFSFSQSVSQMPDLMERCLPFRAMWISKIKRVGRTCFECVQHACVQLGSLLMSEVANLLDNSRIKHQCGYKIYRYNSLEANSMSCQI